MASRAHEYFEQIKAAGDETAQAAFLRKLVADQKRESEYLDFKSGRIQADENNLKEHWSKALSGFANTGGGVLVFGIDARKQNMPDGTTVDCAKDVVPVPKPEQLIETLRGVHLDATDEAVRGVDYLAVKELDGTGFVVCLVPEGNHKPYRAMLSGEKYYQRIIDRFDSISHSLLRTLFYPRFTAKLKPTITQSQTRNSQGVEQQILNGSFLNVGKRTVGNMAALVQTNRVFGGSAQVGQFAVVETSTNNPGWHGFQIVTHAPIHPGEHVPAFTAHITRSELPGTVVRVTMYLENQEPLYHVFEWKSGLGGMLDREVERFQY